MKKLLFLLTIFAFLFLISCNEEAPVEQNSNIDASLSKKSENTGGQEAGTISTKLAEVNDKLAATGLNFQVSMAEWITDPSSDEMGQTIYANNRAKQLGAHFVPADPNRGGRTNITWAIDQNEGSTTSGLTQSATNAAIGNAMNTWQDANCSTLPLTLVSDGGYDLGYVQWAYGFGGIPGSVADLSHAGWLPAGFFDAIASGGSGYILGVTFTLVWGSYDIDGNFIPSDIDNNGKQDVAFREIYYNDNFSWAIGSIFDVETVALHEAGHGLSQGHFGKIFRTNANGKLHFSPRAVMNASYSGVQQDLTGTDNGGHCSIWGSWPNN